MVEADAPCEYWNAHVTTNLMNRLIYKDECTKCFVTPKDEHGLSVCLTCFEGFCANPKEGHNHQHKHFENKGHPIYMNIKMTPKVEKDEDGKPAAEKITKLAIGKPGGIDADTDKYDTTVTVFCNTLC